MLWFASDESLRPTRPLKCFPYCNTHFLESVRKFSCTKDYTTHENYRSILSRKTNYHIGSYAYALYAQDKSKGHVHQVVSLLKLGS